MARPLNLERTGRGSLSVTGGDFLRGRKKPAWQDKEPKRKRVVEDGGEHGRATVIGALAATGLRVRTVSRREV